MKGERKETKSEQEKLFFLTGGKVVTQIGLEKNRDAEGRNQTQGGKAKKKVRSKRGGGGQGKGDDPLSRHPHLKLSLSLSLKLSPTPHIFFSSSKPRSAPSAS